MASICCLSFSPLARSSMVRMSWVSHDLRVRKPCWQSVRMMFFSKWEMTLEWMTCSRILHTIDVREMEIFLGLLKFQLCFGGT